MIFGPLTLFSRGGGVYLPPWRISRFSIGKRYQRGVKVVYKFKFSKLLPYQTDFRWAEPRAFKVEWVANFRNSKSWFFCFYLKILQQIIDVGEPEWLGGLTLKLSWKSVFALLLYIQRCEFEILWYILGSIFSKTSIKKCKYYNF